MAETPIASDLERRVFEAITGWPLDEAPGGGVDEDTAAWLATTRAAIPVVAEHIAQQIEAVRISNAREIFGAEHFNDGIFLAARIAREASRG